MSDDTIQKDIDNERQVVRNVLSMAVTIFNETEYAKKAAKEQKLWTTVQPDGTITLYTYPEMVFVETYYMV